MFGKVFALLGLVTFASATTSTCQDGAFLAHESDCNKFYRCNHGQLIEMVCPAGLHFNDKTNNCDWSANANCQVDDDSTSTIEVSFGVCGILENGLIAHDRDCSMFYKCVWGVAIEFNCPASLYFNPLTLVCDYLENVDCSNEEVDGSGYGEDEIEIGRFFESDSTDVNSHSEPMVITKSVCHNKISASQYWAYDGDCTRYWSCENGVQVSKYCSDGLYFSGERQTCDLEANVKCVVDQFDELKHADEFLKV